MLETVVVHYARRNRSHAEEGVLDLSFLCTSLYSLHLIAVRNLMIAVHFLDDSLL